MKLLIKLEKFVMQMICNVVPKDDRRILFYSKPDFSDNSRAVYEELKRRGGLEKYNIVWLVNGNIGELQNKYPEVSFFNRKTIKGFLAFARSKYIFRSHTLYVGVKSSRQIAILLWHGMGIKGPIDFDNKRNAIDYVTVTSDFYKFKLATRFNCYPSRVVITGLPRNDFMFQGMADMCLKNLSKIKSNDGCKVLLWMPTYHTNSKEKGHGKYYEIGIPVVAEADLPILNEVLKKNNVVLLVKLHPHVIGEGTINSLDYSNIQVFSDVDLPADCSLYHLIGGVDALWTDYSSVFTDFMLLDRPVGFVYDDFEEYKAQQGFAFERVEMMMPGQHMGTVAEMISFIEGLAQGKDEFADQRRELNKYINFYCDGNNSYRILKTVGII